MRNMARFVARGSSLNRSEGFSYTRRKEPTTGSGYRL